VGFFNGATALYITPEVGVDPKCAGSNYCRGEARGKPNFYMGTMHARKITES
jgi:hypothetical protein